MEYKILSKSIEKINNSKQNKKLNKANKKFSFPKYTIYLQDEDRLLTMKNLGYL